MTEQEELEYMTLEQWEEIGGIADQEYVDFGSGGKHNIKGWSKIVKELGYMTDEDAKKFGSWEDVFWAACEWA